MKRLAMLSLIAFSLSAESFDIKKIEVGIRPYT